MIVSSASGVIEEALLTVTKTAHYLDPTLGRVVQPNVLIAL